MSFVVSLGPHLPYLRRYARALTGSQSSGDAYVKRTLEVLATDPEQLNSQISSKMALYQFFHQTCRSDDLKLTEDQGTSSQADEKLQRLAPIPRQAFLLSAVEGFRIDQIAQILETTEDNIRDLLDQAQTEIEAQLRTRVMIIEDEPIIAADLASIVSELGHQVTGTAVTHDEALSLVRRDPPGIVLCDVQLAQNSSGIEAAKGILAEFDIPLIFITAYPERLLTGSKPEPAYLITKPFKANTVKATIGQALFFHPHTQA